MIYGHPGFQYSLFASVHHQGSLDTGHYTVDILHKNNVSLMFTFSGYNLMIIYPK